jgi:pyroglutamyl-peptidase
VPAELVIGAGKAPTEGVVLVTGFDPFGGERTNPSWEICKRLPATIAGLRVETCRVPCEFRRAIEVVAAAIERHRPAIVVCIAGAQPIDEPIAPDGPPAHFATLPIKAMTAAMRRAGVPTEVSNSAGTYVCNHLMYGVLHFIAASGAGARAGFVHVPYAEEQVIDKAGIAAMSLDTMARGIEAGIAAAAAQDGDLRASEGAFA